MNLGKTRATTKTRKTFPHAAEYLAVLIFYALLRLLPTGLRLRLAGLFGDVSYLVTPRRVKIAVENLRASFSESPSVREQANRATGLSQSCCERHRRD